MTPLAGWGSAMGNTATEPASTFTADRIWDPISGSLSPL